MGRTRTILISVFIICCVISCKEPFTADALFEETNFLVVEGYINVGPGTTTITLSRTGQLSAKGERQMEANAVVKIEGEDNSSHLLTTVSKGVYRANLNLPSDIRYRLYVKTVEGKEY